MVSDSELWERSWLHYASFLYICICSPFTLCLLFFTFVRNLFGCLHLQVQDGVVTYKGTFACTLSQKPSILCTLSYIRVMWQSWQIFLYILKKSMQEIRIHGSLFDKYLKIKRWMKSTSHFLIYIHTRISNQEDSLYGPVIILW